MDYFIRWQITERTPQVFSSQDKIVRQTIAPMVTDKVFLDNVNNYYVTKANKTDVRLQIFTEESNIKVLEEYVDSKFFSLSLTAKDGPHQATKIVASYGPLEKEHEFCNYLRSMSDIAIDLHLGNLYEAKQMAVTARFRTTPYGDLLPRQYLHEHFMQNSKHYRQLVEDRIVDTFWESFTTHHPRLTPWYHFYYNAVLGLDAPPSITEQEFAAVLGISLK